MTFADPTFTADNNGNGNDLSYPYWVSPKLPFQRGCGRSGAIFDNDGCIALMVDPPNNGTLNYVNIKYGILAKNASTYYSVIDGTISDLKIVPDFTNEIYVELQSGKLSFYEDTELLYEIDYDYNLPAMYLAYGLRFQASTLESIDYNPASFISDHPNSVDSNLDKLVYNDNDT